MSCDAFLNCFKAVAANYRTEIGNHAVSCWVGVKPGVGLFIINLLQDAATTYMVLQPKRLFEYEITPLNGEVKKERMTCRTLIGLTFISSHGLFNIFYNSLFNFSLQSALKSQMDWSVNFVKGDLSYCDNSIKVIQDTGNAGLSFMTEHAFNSIRMGSIFSIFMPLVFSIATLASLILCTQRGVLSTNKPLFALVLVISLATIGLNLATTITSHKCQINGQNALNQWSTQCFNSSTKALT